MGFDETTGILSEFARFPRRGKSTWKGFPLGQDIIDTPPGRAKKFDRFS